MQLLMYLLHNSLNYLCEEIADCLICIEQLKDMGLVKVPKLKIGHDGNIQILGHTGKDITIYPDNYPADNKKAELLGTLRHELEHYKQHLIIFLKKGDVAEQEAFAKQMNHRINCQAAMRPIENGQQAIDEQLIEECHKYGFTTINGVTRGTAGEIRRGLRRSGHIG